MNNQMMVPEVAEADSVARLMGQALRDRVRFLQTECGLAPESAYTRATAPETPENIASIMSAPPEQISWFDLGRLMRSNPEEGLARWQEIKQAAVEELRSGHRAAAVFDWDSAPWERARFLAIRNDFIAEWQPRGGIERALVDTLCECYAAYLYWFERFNRLSTAHGKVQDSRFEREGFHEPPRVDEAEAIREAAELADKLNKIFLRTLRALRDLRRYAPSVMIQNVGQVNIASQQFNETKMQTR
jgi:hypothetical protein